MDTERIAFQSYQKTFKEHKYELDEKVFLKFIGRNIDGIHVPDMKCLDGDVKELAFKICENLFEVRDYLQTI